MDYKYILTNGEKQIEVISKKQMCRRDVEKYLDEKHFYNLANQTYNFKEVVIYKI